MRFGNRVRVRAERTMWLMKCPPLAASSLTSSPSPDDQYLPVAKVIIAIDPLASVDDDETKVVMELARDESGNIPKRYALNMYKDIIPLSVLSASSSHGELTVQGKIKYICDMRLHNDNSESYGQLCRERASKNMCPNTPHEKKKVTDETLEMKRTRREMEEVMFNLFQGQSNWTLRQLIQETDQPEQFIKDLLRDLCIYNNKGSNQGTYELKAEYKKLPQD